MKEDHGSIVEQLVGLNLVPPSALKEQSTGSSWSAQSERRPMSEAMTAVHKASTFQQFRIAAGKVLLDDPSQIRAIAHFSEQFKLECLSKEDREAKGDLNYGKFLNAACWALCNNIATRCRDYEVWNFIVRGAFREENPIFPDLSKAIESLERKRAMTSQEKKQAQKKSWRKH